jgi:uncharacterized delta-60 repeat protein
MKLFQTIFFVVCLHLAFLLPAQSGSLDPSFGDNGFVITNVLSLSAYTTEIALSDERIYSAGTLGQHDSLFVLCQDLSGKVDSSFGINGIQTLSFGGRAYCEFIKSAGSGDIYVGGVFEDGSRNQGFVFRMNRNGNPDSTFGASGIIKFAALYGSLVTDAVVDANGGLCIAASLVDQYQGYGIVCVDSTGQPDLDFSQYGEVFVAMTGDIDEPHSIYRQPDGKLLVVGKSIDFQVPVETSISLLRLEPDGDIDFTFGTNGRQFLELSEFDDAPVGALVQDDGSVIIGANEGPFGFALIRLEENGDPDPSFGEEGIVRHSFGQEIKQAFKFVQQDDGRITTAGLQGPLATHATHMMRFNPDGSLDSSFATQGNAIHDLSSEDDFWTSMILLPEAKVLLAGVIARDNIYQHVLAIAITDSTTSLRHFPSAEVVLQAYPNPFTRDGLNIEYTLIKPQYLKMSIYNQTGHLVGGMGKVFRNAGYHTEQVPLSGLLPPGSFIVEIAGEMETGRVLVVKAE